MYGSSNFRLAVRGVLVTATPLTEAIIGCFEGSLRFATTCDGGRLAAVVVGDEDMPDELGALVAGAVAGSGGGFILGADEGVVEGGRVDVRVVAIVLRNGVDLVAIYFRELPRKCSCGYNTLSQRRNLCLIVRAPQTISQAPPGDDLLGLGRSSCRL